ncbi:MAG: 50S ribosomal protein L10 [Opitutales bacterium]
MRPEKEFLIQEIEGHLDKGDYVFLTNYDRMTVPDIADLRKRLRSQNAEFHVVKNTILNVALSRRGLPDFGEDLSGPTAIITGGNNAPEVAKALVKFIKDKEKAPFKGGLLGASKVGEGDLKAVSEMPPLEQVQAQLLGLLMAPAQKTVNLFHAVPQRTVNVLAAPAQKVLGLLNAYKFKLESESAA